MPLIEINILKLPFLHTIKRHCVVLYRNVSNNKSLNNFGLFEEVSEMYI